MELVVFARRQNRHQKHLHVATVHLSWTPRRLRWPRWCYLSSWWRPCARCRHWGSAPPPPDHHYTSLHMYIIIMTRSLSSSPWPASPGPPWPASLAPSPPPAPAPACPQPPAHSTLWNIREISLSSPLQTQTTDLTVHLQHEPGHVHGPEPEGELLHLQPPLLGQIQRQVVVTTELNSRGSWDTIININKYNFLKDQIHNIDQKDFFGLLLVRLYFEISISRVQRAVAVL